MIGLSNSTARHLFQYYDHATDSLQEVTYPDGSQPRRIDNYVLDTADWQSENRGPRRSGPPLGTNTRATVLAHGVDDSEPCFICRRNGKRCLGYSCVRSFRRRIEEVTRSGELRIEREAIPGVALGYGVFTWGGIRKGDIMGEYLGRLHPLDRPRRLEGGHLYAFELEGVATVDAREYGSVGLPFLSSSCPVCCWPLGMVWQISESRFKARWQTLITLTADHPLRQPPLQAQLGRPARHLRPPKVYCFRSSPQYRPRRAALHPLWRRLLRGTQAMHLQRRPVPSCPSQRHRAAFEGPGLS